MILFQCINALAYNLRALSLTLDSSKMVRSLQLNQQLQIMNGVGTWRIKSDSSGIWEIEHLPSHKNVYLLQSAFKLSDLTKGTQVLLKEYGILGIEILNSQLISNHHNSSMILKLDLKQSSTHLNLTQYLFEIFNQGEYDLFTLTCPSEISESCRAFVNAITKVKK